MGARLHQAKRSRATWNDRQENRKERWRWCGRRKWRKGRWWKKRKWVLSVPRGNWSGVRLMCQLDHHVFPPHVVLSFHTNTSTPRTTHSRMLLLLAPQIASQFSFGPSISLCGALLVHSPKPLEALLTGRSMSHNPRASDCRGCGSHFFPFIYQVDYKLSLKSFLSLLLGWNGLKIGQASVSWLSWHIQ